MTQGIEAFAELTFNQNKLAQITPLVGGIVKSVEVDLGNRVKQGDLLARVTSVAIGEAQSAYVKALAEDRLRDKTLERERNLRTQRISSEKDLQEAEAAHQSAMAAVQQAQQHLMVLGFDEQQIQALAEQKGTPGVLEIRAPFAGEIVERAAVQGAMAGMGMARGRVEVSNADGKLKAQMFARARILTSSADRAVVVPQAALQNVSGTTVVFVKYSADIFEARPVQLGGKRDGRVEIVAGLKPDEQVVVVGSFALKSQFLISRLGAGCVD